MSPQIPVAREAMTRVVGYIRVSTEYQAQHGVSLEAQRVKLQSYATAMDLELVAIHVDAGFSAKTMSRPGLQKALASLDSGEAHGLLVTKLDRLTRSVRDLCELVDRYFIKDVALLSLGDAIDTRSASGRLVLNILVSLSQWEREAIGERTRTALAHMKAQGVRLGAPALEAPCVARIRALRAEGLSLRDICQKLQDEGVPTLRGGRWAPKVVRAALQRAA